MHQKARVKFPATRAKVIAPDVSLLTLGRAFSQDVETRRAISIFERERDFMGEVERW